ncbi:hypothetical protein ACFSHR_15860 [Azotobacter chroococcum]
MLRIELTAAAGGQPGHGELTVHGWPGGTDGLELSVLRNQDSLYRRPAAAGTACRSGMPSTAWSVAASCWSAASAPGWSIRWSATRRWSTGCSCAMPGRATAACCASSAISCPRRRSATRSR